MCFLRKISCCTDYIYTGFPDEGAGLVTKERIADAFDRMDGDGKGYISHEDLKNILGEEYDMEMTNKMIEEGDFKKNGRVDYDEFVQLMSVKS